MSKINKVRIINLNYNNNSIKIDDVKFFLDSEDTMFNLRNGGGKSVLVQMIMAPLVHKKYRDLKDRTFESYFTKSVPTYILIEWKLDNSAGFVTTGMMVRKSEGSADEDTRDALDIINFISEYKYKYENDIDGLPFIDDVNGRKTIKSFGNTKKLFEDLKKSSGGNFSYYDMNNSYNSTSYFNKLSTFNINYKEWENIVHKINLKESGLSELFSKAKNVEGLLKEWFLPAVEEKLKKDEDRIKNFRLIVNGYINQYKENKSKLEKKKKIELFNEVALDIKETCMNLIAIKDKREALENEIANVREYLKGEKLNTEEEMVKLDSLLEELQGEINEINYERLSLEIYKEHEKEEELIKEIEKYNIENTSEEQKKNGLIREKGILSCAKYYKEYNDITQELMALETQKKLLLEENEGNKFIIEDIGYSIKRIIGDEKKGLEEIIKDGEDEITSFKKEINNVTNSISKGIEEAKELKEKRGSLLSNVSGFNRIEEKFNSNFEESLSRNLEGMYLADTLLNLEKKIYDLKEELSKKIKSISESLRNGYENQKSSEGKKSDVSIALAQTIGEIKALNKELEKLDNELDSRRENLKYVDLKEDALFNRDKIIESFDGKLQVLRGKRNNITKSIDTINDEVRMIKSGKLLELTKELQEELENRGITIVYGMEWLKKNGYTEEKNLSIINNNPLIPYSLIMDSHDFDLLVKSPLKLYTSTPIVIIKRENIENAFKLSEGGIVELNGMDLLVSFNKELINEEKLNLLIGDKEYELKKLTERYEIFSEDIRFLEEKRNWIYHSEITEDGYNSIKVTLEELNNKRVSLELDEKSLLIYISNVSKEIKTLEDDKKKLDFLKGFNERKEIGFNDFKVDYQEYKVNKEKYSINEELITVNERESYNLNSKLETLNNRFHDVSNSVRSFKDKLNDVNRELSEFDVYNEGKIINKDKEDLVAEYRALTNSINNDIKKIKEDMLKLNGRYKSVLEDLNREAKAYELVDKDFKNVKHTYDRVDEVNNSIKLQEDVIKDLNTRIDKSSKEKVRVEIELKHMYKKLNDECFKKVLKDKSLIVLRDYEQALARINILLRDCKKEKSILDNFNHSLDYNISNLSEYDNFTIKDKIEINFNLQDLSKEIGVRKRDLNKLVNDENNLSNRFKREIDNKLTNNRVFSEDQSFKDIIVVIYGSSDNPTKLLDQINIYEESFNMQMFKLSQDIEMIHKEEDKIIENILEYTKDVNENLRKIDDNSTINIKNKSIKMLDIKAPNWDDNLELYKQKLKGYLHQLRDHAIEKLENNEGIEDIISNRVTNYNLYNEIVSVSSVNVTLYKVEEDRQRKITWNEVAKNSGGEGFLSAFVILSSLLSYIRKDNNDIFNKSESGKVLVMDNPFAQTSSIHLLKPLMDIAKKTNTQLICFTALGDDAIYNRFDNIYVLNTVQSALKSGMKYMKSNHLKGNEEEESTLVPARFKVEDQLRLF